MKSGSAKHFTATMYPWLAAVITCLMSVLLVLDRGKRKCIQNLWGCLSKKSDLDDWYNRRIILQ